MSTTHDTVSWGWVSLSAITGAGSLIGSSVLGHPLLRDLPIGHSDITVATLIPPLGKTLAVCWGFLLTRRIARGYPNDKQGGTWARSIVARLFARRGSLIP
jgi:hypothetical protein